MSTTFNEQDTKVVTMAEPRFYFRGGKVKKIIIKNLRLFIDINNKIINKNNCHTKSIKI